MRSFAVLRSTKMLVAWQYCRWSTHRRLESPCTAHTHKPRHYRVANVDRHHGPYLSIQGIHKPRHYRVANAERYHGLYLSIQGKEPNMACSSSLHFTSWLPKMNIWNLRKHDYECCHFVPSSLHQWCHEQGWKVWLEYQMPKAFFCSLLERWNMAALWGAQIEHKKSTSFV